MDRFKGTLMMMKSMEVVLLRFRMSLASFTAEIRWPIPGVGMNTSSDGALFLFISSIVGF